MMRSRTVVAACAVLIALVACGKRDQPKEEASSSEAPRDTAASTAGPAYRAFGNEPFWSVTIDASGMHFVSPEDSVGIHYPATTPESLGDTLRWSGKTDRGTIDVRIWPGACSDGMSDQTHSHSSAVRLNDTNYVGCAQALTQ